MNELSERIKRLKEAYSFADVLFMLGYNPKLKGNEYEMLCPHHEENTPSYKSNKNKDYAHCFGCGAHDDIISITQHTLKLDNALKAVEWLEQRQGELQMDDRPAKRKSSSWTPITPVPPNAVEPDFHHYQLGEPSMIFPYKDNKGRLLGYVARYDTSDGKKETRPLTYCSEGTKRQWRWQSWDAPRPMYGLDRLDSRPVLVVEGEKAANYGHANLKGYAVLAWPGGTNAINHIDWEPLCGRDVTYWPDTGASYVYHGKEEAQGLKHLWEGLAKSHNHVSPPEDSPKGWDIADHNGNPMELITHIEHCTLDSSVDVDQVNQWKDWFDTVEYNPEYKPDPRNHILYFGDRLVGKRQNLVVIQGPPKVGKTTLLSLICSALLNDLKGQTEGAGNIKSTLGKGALVGHMDTEQDEEDYHESLGRVLDLQSIKYGDVAFRSFWATGNDTATMLEAVVNFITIYSPDVFILDGIAHLVNSENDLEECNPIVKKLLAVCVKNSCMLLTVIHTTGDTQKAYGFLGTILHKLAMTVVGITPTEPEEDHDFSIFPVRTRKQPFIPFHGGRDLNTGQIYTTKTPKITGLSIPKLETQDPAVLPIASHVELLNHCFRTLKSDDPALFNIVRTTEQLIAGIQEIPIPGRGVYVDIKTARAFITYWVSQGNIELDFAHDSTGNSYKLRKSLF